MKNTGSKYSVICTMVAVIIGYTACSSEPQQYEGWLKYDKQACEKSSSSASYNSNGGKREKSICECENGIVCYGSWVCDGDNNTCKVCHEGETKCEDGKTSQCINGQWTDGADCASKQCTDDMKACKAETNCIQTCKNENILILCNSNENENAEIECPYGCKDKQCESCNEPFVCNDGKNLTRCNGKDIKECANGCQNGENKCKPMNSLPDVCKGNDSVCILDQSEYAVQYQCLEGQWSKDGIKCESQNCSNDGKTCEYCTESKCEGNILKKCDGGRWIDENCTNGCDDGAKKCKTIEKTHEICDNQADDDKDGKIDCDDEDCADDAVCKGDELKSEICDNKADDDEDGKTDCDDEDCSEYASCKGGETKTEVCDNQADDDDDGKVDCEDEDCADDAVCKGGETKTEVCDNKTDDDEDGKTDCDDEDCTDNNNCKTPPQDGSKCKVNSYQCVENKLKCITETENLIEVTSAMNLEIPQSCPSKDNNFYCQGGGKTGTLEDACECTPNDPRYVYCFNNTGYFCNNDKTLIDIACSCNVSSFVAPSNISSEFAQCQYKCKLDNYSCNEMGILMCDVDVPSKVPNVGQKIADSYVVTPNNDTNKNKLLEHCLKLEHSEYLCEQGLKEKDFKDGKCCTPNEDTYLCFGGNAYACNSEGKIDENPIPCETCNDKYGTIVDRSKCSTSPKCDNSGYLCKDKNSLICSLEGKWENGKTGDTCCNNLESDVRPNDIHCEGCVKGYYRCGPANSTSTSGIGDTSYAQRCDTDHWENDKSGGTHVLGIVWTEVTPLGLGPYYRLFDCFKNTDSEGFDKAMCMAFSIDKDNLNIYDINNSDGIKMLYDKFKKGSFNTIEFACLNDDRLEDIVDTDYYVYVQRDYNKDFSDNIGTNILYKVVAEKKDVPSYFNCSACRYIVTINKI